VRGVSHLHTTGKTKVLYTLLDFKSFRLQSVRYQYSEPSGCN
jgi:hypothetical protein